MALRRKPWLAHPYDALDNRVRTALPDGRALHWLFYGSGHWYQVNLEEAGAHRTLCDVDNGIRAATAQKKRTMLRWARSA